MGGRELLWYQAPPAIHAALLRGTTADEDGNISFEDEAFYADSLNQVRHSPSPKLMALDCLYSRELGGTLCESFAN